MLYGVILPAGPGLSIHLAVVIICSQKLVFEDKRVHPDCQADMVKALHEIEQYCYD